MYLNSKLSDREKIMAFILNKEFKYAQGNIATLMKVSQPTIANAVKEAGYWIQINQLQKLYLDVKDELYRNGFREMPNLIENSRNIIDFGPDGPSFFDKK